MSKPMKRRQFFKMASGAAAAAAVAVALPRPPDGGVFEPTIADGYGDWMAPMGTWRREGDTVYLEGEIALPSHKPTAHELRMRQIMLSELLPGLNDVFLS